jgi:vesicle transport through interaction with t-SNAREs 1
MEIELQGIPQSMKSQYQARLKTAKTALTRFKKLSKETHSQLARSDLLSSATRPGGYANATTDEPYEDERARLLQGTATLSDGSRRLQDAQRIALETENQGADILRNLRQQREQIENSRDVVGVFFIFFFFSIWSCFLS